MASKPIIYVVGPTASGKTALALRIAKKYSGEIICADSRTVYNGLTIATAKPTSVEQSQVRHWCIDMVEPDQRYSAAQFQHDAKTAIADMTERGKLPIVVGGTGLYIDGLLFDYQFGPGANEQLRHELETQTVEVLQKRLADAGLPLPENSKNKRYLIRTLEQGGINAAHHQPASDSIVIGINPAKEVLEQRIHERAVTMIQNGAVQEAQWLFDHYGYNAPAAAAPFYKAFKQHFINSVPLKDCLAQYEQYDVRLAKRQKTWFKRNPYITWFDTAEAAWAFVEKRLTE